MAEIPPIEQCAREGCGKMFFKTRSDRQFCSNSCAARKWYVEVSEGKRRPVRRPRKIADAETNQASK